MIDGDSGTGVTVEVRGRTMVITFQRPEQRNAMTFAAGQEIAAALDRLDERADLSVAILSGGPTTFCAGMDLKRFAAGEAAAVPGRGFGGVTQSPPAKPLIAAVEGYALGGGLEMALACDLVVAGRSAKLGLPEVRRGLVARGGGLVRLPQWIPRAVALELVLVGEPIDATRAYQLGLVNRVTDDGEALAEAHLLAAAIAANGPLAVRTSKRIVTDSATWPPDGWFDRQKDLTDAVMSSKDASEGALAFIEKRAPVWSGE
jgi:enoyl-CoA hydratase